MIVDPSEMDYFRREEENALRCAKASGVTPQDIAEFRAEVMEEIMKAGYLRAIQSDAREAFRTEYEAAERSGAGIIPVLASHPLRCGLGSIAVTAVGVVAALSVMSIAGIAVAGIVGVAGILGTVALPKKMIADRAENALNQDIENGKLMLRYVDEVIPARKAEEDDVMTQARQKVKFTAQQVKFRKSIFDSEAEAVLEDLSARPDFAAAVAQRQQQQGAASAPAQNQPPAPGGGTP